jgi:hypothetical protein
MFQLNTDKPEPLIVSGRAARRADTVSRAWASPESTTHEGARAQQIQEIYTN